MLSSREQSRLHLSPFWYVCSIAGSAPICVCVRNLGIRTDIHLSSLVFFVCVFFPTFIFSLLRPYVCVFAGIHLFSLVSSCVCFYSFVIGVACILYVVSVPKIDVVVIFFCGVYPIRCRR